MAIHPSAMPSSDEVRETLFDRWYFPYRKQIWSGLIVGGILIIAALAVRQWQQKERDAQWNRLAVAAALPPADRVAPLRRLIQDYPAAPVTPFALQDLLAAQIDQKSFDEALATLTELRAKFPDFVLSTEGSGDANRSLAHQLEDALRSQAAWSKEHAYVHPAPNTDRVVLVETTEGSFWLGLYPTQAGPVVDEFLRRVKAGAYNGTQVYSARSRGADAEREPLVFEAGSRWSNVTATDFQRDPGEHDREEPDAVREPGEARFAIRHQRGVVSTVLLADGESLQRFQVILSKTGMISADGQSTPFAAVLDREGSLEVADRIGLVPTYGTADATKDLTGVLRMRDHPYPAVFIRRVSVWSSEKLEDGHAWDTSRARSKDPEPWEASLPRPFGPEDLILTPK